MSKFLDGKRIYLRPIMQQDLSNYFDWLNDQELTRYMQRGVYPNNMDEMQRYHESMQGSKDNLHFAIIGKEGNMHIGNIALLNIHQVFRTAEISIIVGAKHEHGKGYGTEAIKLLVDHAFMRMNLNRIGAGMVAKNEACKRSFLSAGFLADGKMRQLYYCDGEYQDVWMYSILKTDWEGTK